MRRGAGLGLVVVALAACGDDATPSDYGDPTSLNTATERQGITAYVVSPTVRDRIATPSAALVVSAWTADAPRPLAVTVTLPEGQTLAAAARGNAGPAQRFTSAVPLLHGANALSIRVATADQSRIRYLAYTVRYAGANPGVRAFFSLGDDAANPCAGARPLAAGLTGARRVCLQGRATASGGAVARVEARGGASAASATPAPDGTFAVAVDLAADQRTTFTLTATDAQGRRGTATAEVVHDGRGPTLSVDGVAAGATVPVSDATYALRGAASDDNGLAALRVEFGDGGVLALDAAARWTATVRVSDGDNPVAVVAVDRAGNATRVPFVLRRDREVTLRPPAAGAGTTHLDLDRFALSALLATADQQAIQLIEVPLRPTLLSTLRAIRDPFTTGVDTRAWRQAEWNLNRLLNMTPDSADLRGTSLAPLLGLATAIGLPPPRVLADLLQIMPTVSCVDQGVVADVLLDQLVGTHPRATRDRAGQVVLSLSLYDVLQDLHPLATRFGPAEGPSGAHPGFLSGPVEGRVFEPGFLMSIPARSNLRQYDGVDVSASAKSFLFVRGGGASVIELDFLSPSFGLVGLVDQPTVDLGFAITENPAFLRAGSDRMAGADGAHPGFYRGSGDVWAAAPWQIERIVAETAYRQYRERFADAAYARTLRYDAGSITNAAVLGWSRGWVTITTSGGVGMPPAPSYVWDVLSEVAQVRLHDGIPEGMANLAFTLRGLSIGIGADQLIATLRPTLMAQQAELSRRIVGSSALALSTADVFYLPADDASAPGFLAFRGPDDGPPPYRYAQPGFYDDPGLTRRVSTARVAGASDAVHEKVPATAGRTYYVRDDAGGVYGLAVTAASADAVRVRISSVRGAP